MHLYYRNSIAITFRWKIEIDTTMLLQWCFIYYIKRAAGEEAES